MTHPHPKRNFVPTVVARKSGQVPVNATKQSSPRAAASISTARPVNTAAPKPKVNDALPTIYSYFKAHSLVRRAFNKKSVVKTNNFNEKVNTAKVNNVTTSGPKAIVSVVEGNGENTIIKKLMVDLLHLEEVLKEDETSGILKTFITGIENQINHKIKIIRCDNGTEFKNNDMNQFRRMKGIKREFSVARTPQQNRVAKRKNMTLIEAAMTMLADSLLPTTFWDEAVNTACYVQNRVLVTKPHNKTPYELLHGRPPSISFMPPFGCPMTILNTLDPLGKFDGKADEGFLVGYSINSKAFRVFNTRTRKVEENLHITFLENKPNVARSGPDWLFDIDLLTNSMNYKPVTAGNQTNRNAVS
ncbi:retrovirus-related pol polyprotein from transposon TNT 1-94 [Tanacetum coccineum]